MKNYYVPKNIIVYIFIILLLTTLIDGKIFFLFFAVSFLFLHLYRVKNVETAKLEIEDFKTVFSPVHGKIKKVLIKGDKVEIVINTSLSMPRGFFMPISGAIDSIDDGITILSKFKKKIEVKYSDGFILKSNVWIKTGDLANLAANIGFSGICTEVRIVLNSQAKILVSKNQKVYAGESALAGLGENHE